MKTKLSSINLLTELEQPRNQDLRAELSEKAFPAHSLIFAPGHDQDLVFIVKKGRLRLYLAVEDKDFSLAILEPGDIYATHTQAHVQTIDEVVLLLIPTRRLHEYMASHPALSATIISILGMLLKQSFSIINSLVFKDITRRLIDFLLNEAAQSKIRDDRGIIIELNLTTTALAAVLGSSRQTLSTILGAMLKEGVLVKRQRGAYLLPDLNRLINYVRP